MLPELLVILVIVLIIFGAGKLRGVGGAVGKSIRDFKEAMRESREIDITPKKEQDKSKPT
ncbi:MAG TPA: twin-arginine translocase TatA/TatE family subunit [Syntrophorhabdales bacterium]|nr:twin-arginine translocase TatA/TatE family subunit [Syntrophorhabdales bacterium]